jgi:hypothetical protein
MKEVLKRESTMGKANLLGLMEDATWVLTRMAN